MARASRPKRRKPKEVPPDVSAKPGKPYDARPDVQAKPCKLKGLPTIPSVKPPPLKDKLGHDTKPPQMRRNDVTSIKLISNGARFCSGHQHSKRLPQLPPPRQVRGPDLPRAHLLSLPWEVRQLILEHVFDSALIIMSTTENFGRNLLNRSTTCRSPYDINGIPSDVFPCLAWVDSQRRLHLDLAKRLFGELLHYRNLPYEHGRKVEQCEEHERRIGTAPLFLNKQLAAEFAPILYSRTAFAFGSSAALRKFMDVQDKLAKRYRQQWAHIVDRPSIFSLNNKQNMTSFCLEIKRYGEPSLPSHRALISKFYQSWRKTCAQLVEEVPNLVNVAISMVIPPPPNRYRCQLSLDSDWVSPLLEFGRSRSLQSASVTLLLENFSNGGTEDTCIAFSEVLRRKMLGWSDVDALEALSDFKEQPPIDADTSQHVWEVVERANGMGLQPAQQDDTMSTVTSSLRTGSNTTTK